MGLMDFVSSVGKKLGIDYFERREEIKKMEQEAERAKAEEALRQKMNGELTQAVLALGLSIDGFRVEMRGTVAHLSGTAKSQADKEKAMLCVGNHHGVTQVDHTALSVVVPEPPAVFHEVVKGDTLSRIAQRYYGIIMAYPEILRANQPLIKDEDMITPGWIIRIPPLKSFGYTVKKGDTLGGIAKAMYGDAKKYTVIYEANRGVLNSPDAIEPGQELIIPPQISPLG